VNRRKNIKEKKYSTREERRRSEEPLFKDERWWGELLPAFWWLPSPRTLVLEALPEFFFPFSSLLFINLTFAFTPPSKYVSPVKN